ncbi:MAG: sigma-70 family RNA polymerase sigma factor [Deltaproteobacteria bacterium]|nr:sigma-70 family RNA polymerase sigma factor [Deltaproteobacteria bacterium]
MTPRELDKLYREHGHCVLRRARRLLKNDQDARDVVQDVFLAIFREPERFEAKSSVATYLYAAATHACLNRLRDGKTRTRLVAIEASVPRHMNARGETRALAAEILAGLSDEEAALAVYLFCDELTHDEVAGLLGCSRRHVGDLATRLRRRIMERVA